MATRHWSEFVSSPGMQKLQNFVTPGRTIDGGVVPREDDAVFGADSIPTNPRTPGIDVAQRMAVSRGDTPTAMSTLGMTRQNSVPKPTRGYGGKVF